MLEIRPDFRRCFLTGQLRAQRRIQAAGVDGEQLTIAVAHWERPRSTARRMSGGDVRGELDRADMDLGAVPESMVDARCRVVEDGDIGDEFQWSEARIPSATFRDDVGIALADPQLGAGCLLQSRQTPGVI